MKRFAELYRELDEAKGTNAKLVALERYFREAPPPDAAWALQMLTGNRPRRVVSAARLLGWAAEAAALPLWLVEECAEHVGDLAETIALLTASVAVDPPPDLGLAAWIQGRLIPLRDMTEEEQRRALLDTWRVLDRDERLVWNKLLTGAFRVGAANGLVIRAVARASNVAEDVIAHRLMGGWEPSADHWLALINPDDTGSAPGRPYPFALASPLDVEPATLGEVAEWLAEWKWDGIRAQLVRRGGRVWIWSRGDELLDGRFPELEEGAALLPDGTVLDGEVLPWRTGADRPLPFAHLQRRIGRKSIPRALLAEVPVRFMAYDLLELDGVDQRTTPFTSRRAALAALIGHGRGPFRLSPLVEGTSWHALAAARAGARARGAEGLMLKAAESVYPLGRKRGPWWKWKVDPWSVDAVLIAAQGGRGRRSGLFTDYTFGIHAGDRLVPFAKAYSGLTDAEIREVDAFVRAHTLERHGPVRMVEPRLVFEIAFEGIQRSARHKSGVAVRFPRIARWRHDKTVADADTLERVQALIDVHA